MYNWHLRYVQLNGRVKTAVGAVLNLLYLTLLSVSLSFAVAIVCSVNAVTVFTAVEKKCFTLCEHVNYKVDKSKVCVFLCAVGFSTVTTVLRLHIHGSCNLVVCLPGRSNQNQTNIC